MVGRSFSARADLVDHLLDAARRERVKDLVDDRAHRRCDVRRERFHRVGIRPFEVEPHVQRTVGDIGQRRVFVAHKAAEGTAAQAQQAKSAKARRHFNQRVLREFDTGGRALRTRRCVGDVAVDSAIGNLDGRKLRALRLRVFLEERRGQERAVVGEIVAIVVHRLALDEVLHRVGRDQAGVVACRVGFPECSAVDEHRHARAEDRALTGRGLTIAVQAIDNDVALAVVMLLPAAREMFHVSRFQRGRRV